MSRDRSRSGRWRFAAVSLATCAVVVMCGGCGSVAPSGVGAASGVQTVRKPVVLDPVERDGRLNVIVILADDLGWADTTLYGGTKLYRTPNLERLASRGTLFTRGYANSPICSPSRACLMTGLHSARIGMTLPSGHQPFVLLEPTVKEQAIPSRKVVPVRSASRLDAKYRTIAEALSDAGYATGHFGKWHLGPEPYSPREQGFDVDWPHSSAHMLESGYLGWELGGVLANSPEEHFDDRLTDEAIAFIEERRHVPFYLNYWPFSVHVPLEGKPELVDKYRSLVEKDAPQRNPTYAAMIETLDADVGRLLDTVDRLGLSDSTVIVFVSDNGGDVVPASDGLPATSNAPLRGGKATLWEGGVRIPFLVVWPGVTAPGSRSDALAQTSDVFPTLLDGLGIEPAPEQPFDGVSLMPALRGEPIDREHVFAYLPHVQKVPDALPPAVSVTRADWKLIRLFHDGEDGSHRCLLFDLASDPGETNDLASERPDLVAELDARIETFLNETGAVVPRRNPRYRPEAVPTETAASRETTTEGSAADLRSAETP